MPAYYIESSAWLKRYKSEIGSEVVNELLAGRTADEIFVTSHLSVLEVSAVAARLLKGDSGRLHGPRYPPPRSGISISTHPTSRTQVSRAYAQIRGLTLP